MATKQEELCVVCLNSHFDWLFVGWRSVDHNGIVTMRDARNVYSYNDERGSHELPRDPDVATQLTEPSTTRWTILQECWVAPCSDAWLKICPPPAKPVA